MSSRGQWFIKLSPRTRKGAALASASDKGKVVLSTGEVLLLLFPANLR